MPVIVARRGSPCEKCHLPIVVGERIQFTRATGAQHLTCGDDRDDPEDQVRSAYQGLTSVGIADEQAFDRCVAEFGYVGAVKALYSVSEHAKRREDSYQAMVRQNRERGAARRGGYSYR